MIEIALIIFCAAVGGAIWRIDLTPREVNQNLAQIAAALRNKS
jgi:hypothetical protein